ncbi:hypothetical protein PPL_04269 [Heterostelium album PN500]|uniref:ComC supersandwich domain-containing protein n=1 Tax=Heterostelium pallidum (strain ATCC 26659 / Pp 5 / PN500) TaxID=670386 RepID=D3B736_HETP5|nr:hypothetical protein PPL_04269 [Heterostelium album PN500]EFA82579.1 hypothetical protein PPL_04269 [Heterostelium album PN500]|eukprot:XP_020434696.1 hypothetical protein PPL_04269 [Heterostelium album PN500]
MSYRPPQINTANCNVNMNPQSGFTATVAVTGLHFGPSNSSILIDEGVYSVPTLLATTSYDDGNIFFKANMQMRSGNLSVVIGDQKSNEVWLDISPYITLVRPLKVMGGPVTIYGYYLAPTSYRQEKILDIYFDKSKCTSIRMVGSNMNPYTLICNDGPAGYGNINLTFAYGSGSSNIIYTAQYEKPVIDKVSSTYYQEPADVTIFGSGFVNVQLAVNIGGSECTNPVASKGVTIVCRFQSDVDMSKTKSLLVNVTANGFSSSSYSFIYLARSTTCPNCEHGVCDTKLGVCNCNSGYIGATCNNKLAEIPVDSPKPMENTTQVELGSLQKNILFNVSITEIREVNDLGVIQKQVFLKDIKWFHSTEINNTYTFSGRFSDDPQLQVDISMQVFTEQKEYNFYGDIFTVDANSVKYQVTVSNWTFVDKINSIQILFLSQMPIRSESDCVNSEITGETVDTEKSLRRLEVQQGSGILTAYFSDRMLVDGRVIRSSVKNLPLDDPSVIALGNKTENLNILTAISVGKFDHNVTIDPNFGSLLIQSDSQCPDSENKWRIPVIVTVCVVGGVAIAITATIVLKKKYKYNIMVQTIKMKKVFGSRKDH